MKKSTHIYRKAVAMLFVLGVGFNAYGAPIQINALTDDAQVSSTAASTTGSLARVGVHGSLTSYVAVFELPELTEGTEFSTADFRVFVQRYASPEFNGDLYGLGYRTSSSVLTTDHYKGSNDATATLIQDNFLDTSMTSSYVNRYTDTGGDAALSNYLNAQYQASAADRLLGEDIFIFLRVSYDSTASGGSYRYYNIYTADEIIASRRPYVTYETAFSPPAYGEPIQINVLTDDGQVRSDGIISTDTATVRAGHSTGSPNYVAVIELPELPEGTLFSTADFRVFAQRYNAPAFNADLYGLGYRTSSSVLVTDHYNGANDATATLIQDNFLNTSMSSNYVNRTTDTDGAIALTNYLNAQYQASAADRALGENIYVFLRLSPDFASSGGTFRYYQLYTADESIASRRPYVTYVTYETAFSPPAWVQVPLGGGGYVTGLVSDASGADIYCRTDVGGSFRWVPGSGGNGQWLPITDTIVPSTTPNAHGTMNVVSIAVDPTDRDKLYVAVGRPNRPFSGIYASTDRGATWTLIHSGIAMDGNGTFRNRGERLAVDPNNPNLLWFGSTENGLQKGVKSGSTWTWSQIPSGSVPFGQVASGGKAGVTFVTCDANSGSTITYAGVHDSVGSSGGIYRSIDSGATWTKVGGSAVNVPAGGSVAPNGTLYVTANNLVLKMPRNGSLSAITPATGINYIGVATDPNDTTGNTVYVAESNGAAQHNKIWRSTNGGSTWAMQHLNLNDNRTIARSEPDGTPALTGYWLGATSALLVNPANSSELWASDFFGVARTANAHQLGGSAVGSQAIWYMLQRNQEEIIPEALKNAPTGPELMVAAADVGGYRYNDVSQRPDGIAGNRFTNPGNANVTSLDFSESNHAAWARTWTGNVSAGGTPYGSGATSRDGGVTWTAFGEIDRRVLSRGPAGWEEWDLTTYLATQQAKGVTTVTLILASGTATNNSGATLAFDSKEATNPALRPHLLLNGGTTVTVAADTMIAGNTPTTPNGSSATIGVSYAWGTDANERHTYLKFTLPASPAITSAHLRLHRVAGATGIDFPVGVYACANTSWNESTLVWTGRPAPYSSGIGKPNNDPRYRTAAGLYLSGGRVSVSATHPDRMVWMPFGISTVPHYSHDRGVTWHPASGLPANINRLIGKSNPAYLLIQLASDRVNGDFYIARLSASSGQHHIYRSTDGGVNWSHVGTIPFGSYNIYRVQLAAAPAAGHVWLSDDGVNGTTAGGLWFNSSGGTGTWGSRLANIRAVRQVAFGKAPSGSAYAYSVYFHGYYNDVRGVYRSDDYGSTWTALPDLPSTIEIDSLAGDRQHHGRVFIGTSGRGIFRSTNSGAAEAQLAAVSNGSSHNMHTPQVEAEPVSSAYPTGGDVWLYDDGTYNENGDGLSHDAKPGGEYRVDLRTATVDLQPLKMHSVHRENHKVRSHFTLANPGRDALKGILEITPAQDLEMERQESELFVQFRADPGPETAVLPLVLEPERLLTLNLESFSTQEDGGTVSLRWMSEGEDAIESVWTFVKGEGFGSGDFTNAGAYLNHPFYLVPIYQSLLRDNAEAAGSVDFRIVASEPMRIEVYTLMDNLPLYIDDQGDGTLDGIGNVLAQDANANGYPDISFEAGRTDAGFVIYFLPRPDREPGAIELSVQILDDGKWVPRSVHTIEFMTEADQN